MIVSKSSAPAGGWTPAGVRLPAPWRALVCVVAGALYLALGWWQPLTAPFTHDYAINWAGARTLLAGENLYDRAAGEAMAKAGGSIPDDDTYFYHQLYNSFIQPPIGALSSVPFAPLPWPVARVAWLVLNHAAVWSALLLLWRLAGWPAGWAEISLLLLGTSRPLQICFYYGQGDGLILLALAVGAWGLSRGRGGRGWGLFALGAAATWKLSPIFLGLGLLKARRLALAVGFGAAAALVLAAQFLAIGGDATRTFFADVLPQLLAGTTLYVNVSLPGWVVRLFMDPALAFSSEPPPPLPLPERLLQYALVAGVLGLALALSPARLRRDLWPGFLALWVSAGVLAASVAWEHYQAWAIVGVPWAITALAATRQPLPAGTGAASVDSLGGTTGGTRRDVTTIAAMLVIAWLLMDIPLEIVPLEWRMYLPLKAVAGLLLVVSFGWLLRRAEPPVGASAASRQAPSAPRSGAAD